MRRLKRFALLSLVMLIGIFSYWHFSHQTSKIQKVPKLQGIDKAIEQEFEMTKDPATNAVPRERLLAAIAYAEHLRADPDYDRAAIAGINWTERGPNNVSGRTRAILIDAGDGSNNTVYAGGVGGGLWRTTNMNVTNPTWTPVDDFFENIAISAIAQDPTNSNIIYFGTGEGFFNADAIRGLGIWKTTDGGSSWNQLSSTDNSTFYYVQKIVVDGSGNVFACTRDGGVRRSTNGGTSWTEVLGAGNGASFDRAADIEIASNGDMYATIGLFQTDGIYKSTNGGTSWTKLTGGGLPSTGYHRIELACAPSNSSRVYALFQGTNYDCSGIYRTDNGGTSWTSLPVPGAFGMANFCRGQAWYDLICAVDPNNANRVFIGGIDALVSNNSGSSWSQITQWYGGGGYQYMHADQHAMVFQSGSSTVMYYGNDGGIYRTANANATTPTITGKFDGYNVTQFYAAAMHPSSGTNEYLAGAQDNGTQRFTASGLNNTTEVTGGDGAFCHIDQDQPNIQISSYVYNNYYITSNSWGSNTSRSIGSNAGRFINPTDYDDAANILYGCYNAGSYSYITGVGSSNTTGTRAVSAFAGAQISAVTVSPNVANRVYFGLDNGDVVRVDNAHNSSASGTVVRAGSGYVSSVAIEDGNENHILVAYSNYGVNSLYESTNAGSSWSSVEGNVPDMPVRSVIFVPGNGDQALIGTEVGVWSTDDLNGTSTSWGPSNGGLANVRTDYLQSRGSDNQVMAATHGRGLYTTDDFNGPAVCGTTITSFPYSESFESGLGDWSQAGGDDLDWTRQSGGTPSSGTGPSAAYDGSWYMYVEASSPNYPSKTAIFLGPCFDLSGASSPELSFRYHMLGPSVGSVELQASTDAGATWSSAIWSLSGDQGSAWNAAVVDLSAYAGTTVQLRYFVTTGPSWQGDICIDDLSMVTSGAPPLVVNITNVNNVSCNGGSDGSATASASGGTPPYSYNWSNGATTATASGLSAGSYTVTVSDNGGQNANDNVTITQPSAINLSTSVTDATSGNNGAIDLTVSGGTAPYSYNWSNGATTQDISGLAPGTYSVTVTDNNGCVANTNATVNDASGGGSCTAQVSSYPYTEGFESGTGLWTQASGDDFDWTRNSGGTPSNGTGPSGAAAGSWYMYVETSSPNYPSLTAILNGPCFDLSSLSSPELSFQYHMLGTAVGTLSLQASTDDGASWTTIWSQSGSQGSAWLPATVDLSAYTSGTVSLRYVGTSGTSWSGDLCIDDLSVDEAGPGGGGCTAQVSSYPYSEGFESGTGLWTQAGGDDFDWTRNSGGTPSNGTGPSGAAAGTWYMYVETSSPNFPTLTAILNGPCFDLSGLTSPEMNFQYHMLGTAVGTLSLQASTDNGSSWSTIWSLSGSQGSAWNGATVDLSAYTSGTVQLRYVGTSGTSWSGDLCVDDISVGEAGGGGCPSIDFNAYTINAYGAGQDAGSSSIQDGGATLFLQNNAWKSISYNYTVTANTVIEFDFQSTLEGEIHGIGFDSDDAISSNLTFKVHGTQAWGLTNYDNYSGSGWTTYTIPVGTFYTGAFDRLFFVADHDASPSNGNAYFRNVKVYEGSCSGNIPVFTDNLPIEQLQNDAGPFQVECYPNPFKTVLHFKAFGGEGNIDQVNVKVYNGLGQMVFERKDVPATGSIDLGHKLSSGVYFVQIESGNYQAEHKVLKVN